MSYNKGVIICEKCGFAPSEESYGEKAVFKKIKRSVLEQVKTYFCVCGFKTDNSRKLDRHRVQFSDCKKS